LDAETRCSLASKRRAGNPLFFDILTTTVQPKLSYFGFLVSGASAGRRHFFSIRQTYTAPRAPGKYMMEECMDKKSSKTIGARNGRHVRSEYIP
jgi:hypothetical protein